MYLPFRPVKNATFTLYFTTIDNYAGGAGGDVPTATAISYTEISKDGGTFAATSNSATFITNDAAQGTTKGRFKIVLTATEMNADVVVIAWRATNTSSNICGDVVIYTDDGTGGINVSKWLGTAVATPTVAGIPTVALTTSQIAIKKNTALSNFTFLMIDSADHLSPKTGLTVTGTVSIDGAAFTSLTNAVSEVGSGVYKINLAAADTNGTTLMLKFTATGADPRYMLIVTQA